jgi:hypothetical protein
LEDSPLWQSVDRFNIRFIFEVQAEADTQDLSLEKKKNVSSVGKNKDKKKDENLRFVFEVQANTQGLYLKKEEKER